MIDKLLILRAFSTLNQVRDAKVPELNLLPSFHELLEDLRARLAQPEPEPVAWQSRMRPDWEENGWTQWKDCPKEQADNFWKVPHLHDWVYEARALYAAPQKRELIGLTDEEIRNEANHHVFDESFFNGAIWARGQIMGKNNG